MPQLPQQLWLMKWDIILECFTTRTVSYNQYPYHKQQDKQRTWPLITLPAYERRNELGEMGLKTNMREPLAAAMEPMSR